MNICERCYGNADGFERTEGICSICGQRGSVLRIPDELKKVAMISFEDKQIPIFSKNAVSVCAKETPEGVAEGQEKGIVSKMDIFGG